MEGLLGNPVIQGLLSGAGPMGVRAQSQQQMAAMTPRAAGGRLGAPSAPAPDRSGAAAIASLGESAAKAIKGYAVKQQKEEQFAAETKMYQDWASTLSPEMQAKVTPLIGSVAGHGVLGPIVGDKLKPKDDFSLGDTRYAGDGTPIVTNTDLNKMIITGEDGNPTLNPLYLAGKQRIAEAGRSNTTVNNVNQTESEFDKVVGKGLADEFTGVQNAASAAQDTLNLVNTAGSYLEKIETGAITPTLVGIKSFAKSFGVDLDALGLKDDVASAEAFRSISGQFLMDFIAKTKGSVSDSENKLFQSFSPGLGNTKEGNKFLLDIASRKAKRDRDLATFANQYVKENGRLDLNWYDAKDEWLRKNTLLTEDVLNRYEALGSIGNDTIGNKTVTTPGVSGSGQMGRGDWSIRKVD